ncbi:MAG: leucine-rich repeat domain-containing protein [Eubacterium sp.]
MKETAAIMISLILFITVFFSYTSISFAELQTEDIPNTQLGDTQTYYSFDAASKTLVISGEGNTPNVGNTSASQPWFAWRSDGSIEHVIVEEGITGIGDYLFYFVSTADFQFPSTLKSIGQYSMAYTNSAGALTLYEGLETISANAFYTSTGLTEINIPSTVTSIGASAFENCISLTNVAFDDWNMKVTLSKRAFYSCSSLKEITVPKRASLSSYSIGYYNTVAGSVYEDLIMYVYRNSPAHAYAEKNLINYVILDEAPIKEGDRIDCTYYSDTDAVYSFSFTPQYDGYYNFFSSGEVDVNCSVEDSGGNVIAEHSDISLSDLNFFISCYLTAGETYTYKVSSYMSSGDFVVTLLPRDISSISADFSAEGSAFDFLNSTLDILSQIQDKPIEVTYETGYTETVAFSNGASYNGKTISYSAGEGYSEWSCGLNYAYVSVGDVSTQFCVNIIHSYTSQIIDPTLSEDGYTLYTCILCADSYKDNFVEKTAIEICGKIVLMQDVNDYHPDNIPMSNIEIKSGDVTVAVTDENGNFGISTEKGKYTSLTAVCFFGPERTFDIPVAVNGVSNVGEICLMGYDFNQDNYVNAKDYALFKSIFGEFNPNDYDEESAEILRTIDYDRNGIFDDNDWQWAKNFFTFGNLKNRIYPQ